MKFKLGNLVFVLLAIIHTGCKKEKSNIDTCDSSNSIFRQLYVGVANTAPNDDLVWMDLETHSYSFEVSENKTVCQIGYQSLPTFNATPYLIEIYDDHAGSLVYSGSHLFSSTATSYESIAPVQLIAGNSYTIKRIQKNWNGNISNTIGRLVHGNLNFPVTFGELTITGSTFYGTGGPANNIGIPYIDLVFEN